MVRCLGHPFSLRPEVPEGKLLDLCSTWQETGEPMLAEFASLKTLAIHEPGLAHLFLNALEPHSGMEWEPVF